MGVAVTVAIGVTVAVALGFIEYFKKYAFWDAIRRIPVNSEFSSFGPYDGKIVSAFWNLNIYTNQRHLALGYAFFIIFFLLIYYFSKNPKKLNINVIVGMGAILGLFPFVHLSVFLVTGLSLFAFLLLYPQIRKEIFLIGLIALVLAIPQVIYMGNSHVETTLVRPGYLVTPLTFNNFIKYWFYNFGLIPFLSVAGFYLAGKNQKKVLIPFLLFFALGNLLQLSPDMPTNHKFFNLTLIGLNFFTAFFLFKSWQSGVFGKIFASILLIPLTLTLSFSYLLTHIYPSS